MRTRILAGAGRHRGPPPRQRETRGMQPWCLVLDSLASGYQPDVDERNQQLSDTGAVAFHRGGRLGPTAPPVQRLQGGGAQVNAAAGRRQARLHELQRGTTIEAALSFYDALEPVGVEDMIGSWRGEGLPTGNPFDGLLERFGWHGKRFDGPDQAHPLVFCASVGWTMSLNPAFVPITALIRYTWLVRAPVVPGLFCVLRPLLATAKPKARLRLTAYRGVVTATMCYDALPINDVFRMLDNDTVVGAMDLRGLQMPFMFVLRREMPGASAAVHRPDAVISRRIKDELGRWRLARNGGRHREASQQATGSLRNRRGIVRNTRP
jgi:hypothetical protein